jgi:hypothetical protein
MTITRKEFERLYSADLLPSSMENYSIGDIWNWEGLFNQKLIFCNENVTDVFLSDDLRQKLKSIPKIQANLPTIDMTSDIKADATANVPILKDIQLSNSLNVNSIVSFSFGNVMGRNILDCRALFNQELEKLKTGDFNRYKDKIRDNNIAMQYWYAGNVSLTVDRKINDTANLKLKIQGLGLEFTSNVAPDDKETIVIKSADCPFAAQLTKGRDL